MVISYDSGCEPLCPCQRLLVFEVPTIAGSHGLSVAASSKYCFMPSHVAMQC